MAIAHLSMRVGSRANGATAAGLAAYVLREGRHATKADELVHTESGNMPGWVKDDPGTYWQAADEFERANGCLFREVEFSLPRELSRAQQIALASTFCRHLADSRSLPWTMALHDAGTGNPHVHLMLSERQNDGIERSREQWFRRFNAKEPEKGGALKTRALGPGARWVEFIRGQWEEFANAALEQAACAERISMASYAAQGIAMTPGSHHGVAGHMAERGIETERAQEQARRVAEQRAQVEANPLSVLERLTHTQATFTRRDIARELGRHVEEPQAFANLMARIEASPDLMLLRAAQGPAEAIYTTRDMFETEALMQGHAAAMARRQSHALPRRAFAMDKGSGLVTVLSAVAAGRALSEEQQAALSHVLGPEQIALVAGGAGTGKSTMLGVARQAWEAEGYRVIGTALAGKAADELQGGSGIRCSTIASLELRLKKGKEQLGPRDVLVIDEAGMVGSRQMGRVLEAAQKAGAKVVLVGDAEQLQPIEAGAAFRAIAERIGFAEISTVRRQREDWARQASRAFARTETRAGLKAYEQHGAIRSVATRDDARAAIAAAYMEHDGPRGPSQIILAHSNRDVEALNQAVRQARRAVGGWRLGIDDTAFPTARGVRHFAVDDRVVFLKNDRELGVKNGTLGTVITAGAGGLAVRLDGTGRPVIVTPERYDQVDHGYAMTLHKAQGVTVDRAYVLATPGMDRHLAYVGMTRHRDEARLYYGREDFQRREDLHRILSRARPATTTLDFAERRGIETRRGWLETGRDALATLGRRLERAIARVRELGAERGPSPVPEVTKPTAAGRAQPPARTTDPRPAPPAEQVRQPTAAEAAEARSQWLKTQRVAWQVLPLDRLQQEVAALWEAAKHPELREAEAQVRDAARRVAEAEETIRQARTDQAKIQGQLQQLRDGGLLGWLAGMGERRQLDRAMEEVRQRETAATFARNMAEVDRRAWQASAESAERHTVDAPAMAAEREVWREANGVLRARERQQWEAAEREADEKRQAAAERERMRAEIAEIAAIVAGLDEITEKADGGYRLRFAAALPSGERQRQRDLLQRHPDEARAAIRDELQERARQQERQLNQGQDQELEM